MIAEIMRKHRPSKCMTKWVLFWMVYAPIAITGCHRSEQFPANLSKAVIGLGSTAASSIQWSSDERYLAIQRVNLTSDGEVSKPFRSRVEVWDIHNNQRIWLATGDANQFAPSWLPDGRLLFTQPSGKPAGLVVADVTKKKINPIGAGGSSAPGCQESAMLNDNMLLYTHRENDRSALRVCSLDGRIDRIWLKRGDYTILYPCVSPNRNRVALIAREGGKDRFVVVNTSQPEVRINTTKTNGDIRGISWLDNERVLFLTATGSHGVLTELDLRSHSLHKWTEILEPYSTVRINRARNLVAVSGTNDEGKPGITIFDYLGRSVAKSPRTMVCGEPAWSPDGRFLAINQRLLAEPGFGISITKTEDLLSQWKTNSSPS